MEIIAAERKRQAQKRRKTEARKTAFEDVQETYNGDCLPGDEEGDEEMELVPGLSDSENAIKKNHDQSDEQPAVMSGVEDDAEEDGGPHKEDEVSPISSRSFSHWKKEGPHRSRR